MWVQKLRPKKTVVVSLRGSCFCEAPILTKIKRTIAAKVKKRPGIAARAAIVILVKSEGS